MAVDEVLWHQAADLGKCCWRFYRWSEPTLSLGYFQPYEDRHRHPASEDCTVVRRISGGGAILHDAELTYCLVLPAGHPLAVGRLLLYEAIHTALIEALARFGVNATLCANGEGARGQGPRARAQGSGFMVQDPLKNPQPPTLTSHLSPLTSHPSPLTPHQQPFLCFQRRAAGDVVAGGAKIAGSAQRRSRGAVLQHGSVLLDRSPAAPELGGLADLTAAPPDDELLVAEWCRTLYCRLGIRFERAALDDGSRLRAAELSQSKYASDRWTKNRGR